MKTRNVTELVSAATDSPRDVLTGDAILTSVGSAELTVENFRGIIEYNDRIVRFRAKAGQYTVAGKGLHIEYYSKHEMKVQGRITAIQYP